MLSGDSDTREWHGTVSGDDPVGKGPSSEGGGHYPRLLQFKEHLDSTLRHRV